MLRPLLAITGLAMFLSGAGSPRTLSARPIQMMVAHADECETTTEMYQWREDDIIFDDYGHIGQSWSEYDRNSADPGGEWYHDGSALVPQSEGHTNWEDNKIADHHTICPPQ